MRNVVTAPEQAARYRAAGCWTPETLSAKVVAAAREHGDSVAVVDRLGQRSRTYEQLAAHAAAFAGLLAGDGIAAGDVVAVQLPNWYEAVVAAVAVSALGGVINPLLPNYRGHELTHVFTTAKPKAILTPAAYRGYDHRALIADVMSGTGLEVLHIVVDDAAGTHPIDGAGSDSAALAPGVDASQVSELIFTSGTEATPKAIMHTEETANFGARSLVQALGLGSGSGSDFVVWMPSPVGHSTGFNFGLRLALISGVPLVLQDIWNASEAMTLVRAFGCRYTLAATTFLQDLVGECERTNARLPSLTHFGCGGAPVPAPLVARAEAVGIQVLRLYGSTEVLCATWNRPSVACRQTSERPTAMRLPHTDDPATR